MTFTSAPQNKGRVASWLFLEREILLAVPKVPDLWSSELKFATV